MNCNCILILVESKDCRKMFLLASFIFVIRACQGEKRKSPTWGKEPLNAAACGKTERKGEHKIARQNASSPASRVSLRYNCASRTRMAVAEDVRRRSRRRLCQTNRRTMRTLTFLRSDVTQTNQRKRRGRDKKGDRIQRRHFIRERMDLGTESPPKNVELFHASIIGLAAVDTKPGPSHSNRVQYGRGSW